MGFHYLLLAAAALFLLQSLIFRRFSLRAIQYERSLSASACFVGDEIELIERLSNEKWLPVPWLRVESQFKSGLHFRSLANLDVSRGDIYQNHKSLFSLSPNMRITRRHSVTCLKRGLYRLESVSISAGDLFGLYPVTEQRAFDIRLIVYPDPMPLDELPVSSSSWQGDIAVKRWVVDDPFAVAGTREYRAGDSPKSINWSATARSGKLQVHKREYTSDIRLMIALNVEDREGMWKEATDVETIEQAIRMAAGYAEYAAKYGLEAGLASNGGQAEAEREMIWLPSGSGIQNLSLLYEALAKLIPYRVLSFHELIDSMAEQLEERTDILLITAYRSDKMNEAAERLSMLGHSVNWVLVPGASGGEEVNA
ncbi:DUF58 domain-containing protein [Paenibacillus sambharensis]|uniref:DUF58 domain-containing protein n=1 Tax=Paenibacillus sambharensis TaxID=1803190 RepID=A0A2W1LQ44_9BACL|nr:DUF58 domain-containing protein [Paenibacillus sambharensis]PZD97062.1 DUF58 domain-containing protein [Paenibacillus sambharensis]